jgi:hypothetical protein
MLMRVDEAEKDVLLVSLTGLESQYIQEDVMVQGSGLSRGDKRRNAKLAQLRELVPTSNAILRSIWPMRSRPWCSPIMIRGCWPAAW